MLIFKLAKRNLWRNKRRTIITMVSIAFGVLLCMFFTGTSDGSYEKLINTAARLGHGHITIMNKNFLRSQDSSYAIPNAVFIEKALSSMKEITFMEKKISGSGMLSSAYDSIAVAFDAVEMDKNQKYSIIKEKITEGSFLTEDKRDVLIGKTLAERLNLQIGSKVVLTVNDRENEITQELFRVRGIYSTGSDLSDGFYAVFHLSKIREVLKYGEEEASIIALYTSHYRDVDKVIKKIKNEHPSFFKGSTQIYPWHEVMEELAQWISVDTGSNYIMQGFLFLVIAAGILNTILMSVLERMREFGIMIALGYARVKLFVMIIFEAVLLGFWGIIFGSGAGWLVDWYFKKYPIDLTRLYGESITISGVAWEAYMRTGIFVDHFFIIIGLIFLSIMVFSLYPALKASHTDPIEAIEKNL